MRAKSGAPFLLVRVVIVTVAMLLSQALDLSIPPISPGVRSAFAQAAALRLDLARVSRVIIYHPTLLEQDGYGATYIIGVPMEQLATFFRAQPCSRIPSTPATIFWPPGGFSRCCPLPR